MSNFKSTNLGFLLQQYSLLFLSDEHGFYTSHHYLPPFLNNFCMRLDKLLDDDRKMFEFYEPSLSNFHNFDC